MEFTKGKVTLIFLLLLLGIFFSSIYATAPTTISINPQQGSPDIARIIDQQIENKKIGPYDSYPTLGSLTSENTGKIENGNLFLVWTRPQYTDGLWIQLELVNRKNLDEKYISFVENIAIYQATSNDPNEWENNHNWESIPKGNDVLKLTGSPLTFQVKKNYVENDYPIVVALDNGEYQVEDNSDPRPKPVHYLSIEEGDY